MESELRLYSIGYVSIDKAFGSKYIRTIAVEASPQVQGVIEDSNVILEFTGIDEEGESFSVSTNSTASIIAEWIGSDSQRMTPPDVRKGELVNIYKYANEDRYFWEARNVRSWLRDTEHVVYLVSAKPQGDRAFLSIENSYSFIVSSKDKQITLRMSNYNGEKTTYLFQMDGNKGTSTWMDGRGQKIFIESLINRITLINRDKSSIKLDKQNILVDNKGNFIQNTDKDVIITCDKYKVNCNEMYVNAKSNVTLDTPQTTITGMLKAGPTTLASLSIAPPTSRMRAAMAAAGIDMTKTASAICNILGDLKIEGDIQFVNGSIDMGGGNITNIGTASGNLANFSNI